MKKEWLTKFVRVEEEYERTNQYYGMSGICTDVLEDTKELKIIVDQKLGLTVPLSACRALK